MAGSAGDVVMKYYRMKRLVDDTGNSGTGYVAEVVVGGPGTAIVLWSEDSNALGVASVVVYPGGIADVEKVHGHGGKTVLEEAIPDDVARLQRRIEIAERKCKEVAFSMFGGAISYSGNFA